MSTTEANPFQVMIDSIAEQVKDAAIAGATEALNESSLREIVREEIKEGAHFVCYSEKEAAALLGMSKYTLAEIRRAGEIKFTRSGGKFVRYLPKHLQEYAERNTV